MGAVHFDPQAVTPLAGSLLLAGVLRFLQWAEDLSEMAPGILFGGVVGYMALVVALLWPRPEGRRILYLQIP